MSEVLTPKSSTETTPATRRDDPLASLRQDMNRMLEEFWRGAPLSGLDFPRAGTVGFAAPAVDFRETDKAYLVTAELPGLEKADVSVSIDDGVLLIAGEKRSDHDEKTEHRHISERRFGEFQRAFSLPGDVDETAIKATFEKGVLSLTLPRIERAATAKRIDIK